MGFFSGIGNALFVLALIGLPRLTHSAANTQASALDQKAIHEKYNDGDFDAVILTLEKFRKTHPNCTRAESTFIAKHLAVVYSANPSTREKGKYYMYQLLEMLPTAQLMDMFVSDEIDRIFEKVRQEYVVRQKGFGVDSTQMDIPRKAPSGTPAPQVASTQVPADQSQPPTQKEQTQSVASKPKTNSRTKTLYWIGAGTAGIALGVLAYFALSSPEEPEPVVYVIQ